MKIGSMARSSIPSFSLPLTFFGFFGCRSGRDTDKFPRVLCNKGVTGCSLLNDHTLSVIEVEISEQIDLGTKAFFVGPVVPSEVLREGAPLTYHYYHEVLKGKTAKNAPTCAE
jgi:hypothetical protein